MTTNGPPSPMHAKDELPVCKPGERDCWNKIGVAGNRLCPELATFIHCRNCPVHAAAARSFFDRPAPEGYLAGWSQWLADSGVRDSDNEAGGNDDNEIYAEDERLSVLIFRLGPEWLAFRTRTIAEVTKTRPVHQVPQRTNDIFRGLVNLQGQVQLCVSLHGLLGVTAAPTPMRLIVLRDRERSESWAFAADEVLGVEHVPRGRWRSVPSTLVNPSIGFSQAVLSWKDRSIGLLDELRIFAALGVSIRE